MLPAPLKVASISIGDKLFQTNPRATLASDQDTHFRKELRRIEQERSNSSRLSRLFMDSEENRFLSDILTRARSFRNIQEDHPRILREAIGRTPQAIAMAAAEWNAFAEEFYRRTRFACTGLAPVYRDSRKSWSLWTHTRRAKSAEAEKTNTTALLHFRLRGAQLR